MGLCFFGTPSLVVTAAFVLMPQSHLERYCVGVVSAFSVTGVSVRTNGKESLGDILFQFLMLL